MTRIHARSRAWVPDITWSRALLGTEVASCHSPAARSPQAGQQPCVGEGMDGERTHHCHRRCGHRGQLPPARQRRGIRVWTTAWTECRRTAGGCGRRRRIPRPSWACTPHPQPRPQPGPSECELSGEVACPSGARKGEVLPAAGSVWATHRVAVDELGRVARHTGSRWYPQECPQPVDLWTTEVPDRYSRVGHGVVARAHTGGEKPVDKVPMRGYPAICALR